MDIFNLIQEYYNSYESNTEKWESKFNSLPKSERELKFRAIDEDGNEMEISATVLVQSIKIKDTKYDQHD